jgi:hypothetical protein
MQFINEAPLYKLVRITGPTHNFLGLELSEDPAEAVSLEALDGINPSMQLDETEIRTQVRAGIERAKSIFGRDFHVNRVLYVSSDSPSPTVYADLTFEILRRVVAL